MDTKIYFKRNFLTETECLSLILEKREKLNQSTVNTRKINKHVRNSRSHIWKNDIFLMKKFGHESMTFQLTEYTKNGFYDWHKDYYETGRLIRKTSYITLLNDDFFGGAVEFENYGEIELNIGDCVSFSPHLYHQVKPVTEGIRYSLVAWEDGF